MRDGTHPKPINPVAVLCNHKNLNNNNNNNNKSNNNKSNKNKVNNDNNSTWQKFH